MFRVYIDDLLLELERKGVGCYWNKNIAGAVCYADDIALLAPSPSVIASCSVPAPYLPLHIV